MRTTLRLLFVGVLGLAAACQDAAQPTGPQDETLHAVDGPAGSVVAGQYIVVFRDDVTDAPGLARRLARAHGTAPLHTYQHAIRGFAARLPAQAAEALRRNPNVAYVEPDMIVSKVTTQAGATWGIDRIDQNDLPLSTTYEYEPTGSGVHAYILDTGIHLAHTQFTGRVSSGFDFVDDDSDANDCDGHGTHVAGTVGGTTWGVAKQVALVAVRVLDCNGNGSISGVIAGIDWVTDNHVEPAVANMSLGGGASSSLDQAVQGSINAGVFYAVSAGNGDRRGRPLDACAQSPARLAAAMTVGATAQNDTEGSFSNYGTCVDILAPGVQIQSAYNHSNNGSATASGTSMASPHVAGAAALYLDVNPGASPAQTTSALVGNAVQNTISLHSRSQSGGTPNRFLYTGFLNDGGTPSNIPPTAAFSYDCSGLVCTFDGGGSSDSDGSIVSYSWTFGDGDSDTGENTSHTFGAADTYTVTLTVTDNGGASDGAAESVTVSAPGGGGGISLSVRAYKVRGTKHADLTWSGASGTSVDVVRDGTTVTTTANDGAHTDNLGSKGGGSHAYRVCEAGTSTCSSSVAASF